MVEIRWTEEATRWLRDIYEYIATDNPVTAAEVVTGIYQKAQLLGRFPEAGYIQRSDARGNIRVLLYGHYRIAYVLKEPGAIDILGVFHGALDIDRYFP